MRRICFKNSGAAEARRNNLALQKHKQISLYFVVFTLKDSFIDSSVLYEAEHKL